MKAEKSLREPSGMLATVLVFLAMFLGAIAMSTLTVIAQEPPEIVHTPMTSAWVGNDILITATVTDDGTVDEVWLNYTDVASAVSNVTMTPDGDYYNYTIPAQTAAGDITYFIWANDTEDNQNMTATETITVSADDVLPEIGHTPVTDSSVGAGIPISATVTDNVAVDEVWLNYTDVASAVSNVTMTADGDYYNYTIPAQTAVGTVTYFIWANDTSNNVNMTATETITVSADDVLPEIGHTAVTSANQGETILISAVVTDNVAVDEVWLNYTDVASAVSNVTMTADGDYYNYTIPAQTAVGTVTYFIWANDTNDNANQTESNDIAITDAEPPTITHDPVESATAGEDITIEATITDNEDVTSATLYYRKTGEATFTGVAMTATDSTYSAEIPGDDMTTDGVEYYISATDGVNTATSPATNPTTSPHEIEVTEEADTTWLLIAIAIIVIIIIIVVAAAAARRKGPGLEEEEPPLEEPEEESL